MKRKCLFFAVVLLFSCILVADGTPPALGTGTSGDPYQIATLGNLLWVSTNSGSWGSCFIQTANIDASGTENWNDGAGFSPIGKSATKFTGTYNGQEFTISYLYIDRSSNLGLFGYSDNGSIQNISLINVNIVGSSDNIGGISGYCNSMTISNCDVTGTISGSNYIGGICGFTNRSSTDNCYSSGSISAVNSAGGIIGGYGDDYKEDDTSFINNCHSNAIVNVTVNSAGGMLGYTTEPFTITNSSFSGHVTGDSNVGGIVGYTYSTMTITNSYCSGIVTGRLDAGNLDVGGIVGNICSTTTTITNSYCSGDVTGNLEVGGIVGGSTADDYTTITITNSYCSGPVTGISYVGGIAGYTYSTITNSYCYGLVTGNLNVGGFVGRQSGSTFTNCFWDTETTGQSSSDGGTGKTTAEMHTLATFTETDTDGLTSAWDFVGTSNDDAGTESIWDMDQTGTVNDGYPILSWQEGADDVMVDYALPVTLSSFTAIYNGDNPVIQWITCSEMQNSGWNIYRNCEEDYSSSLKLNMDIIPGAGSSTEMHNYAYQDEYEVDNGICYYYWLESISFGGTSENFGPIALNIPEEGEEEETPPVPDQFGLLPNYPNPFNPETCISYNLPFECQTELSIYNIKGKKIITLVNEIKEAGYHSQIWNGKDEEGIKVSSGVYIYRLETDYYKMAKTMVLIK